MPARTEHLSFPANWSVRFLCSCPDHAAELHQGVTHAISPRGMRLLSNHPICQHTRIAIHLMIPHRSKTAQFKIVKVTGNIVTTFMRAGRFLTEVDFEQFEEDGKQTLEQKLLELTSPNLSSPYRVLSDDTYPRAISAQRTP